MTGDRDVSDEEGEEIDGDIEGTIGERIKLRREDDVVKKIADPKLPSDEEVQRHYVCGHIPYRSWCQVCIKAAGRDFQHRTDSKKERLLPEYSWDYCFPGDEFGFKWTVLVGK